jgi:hypothetical protein
VIEFSGTAQQVSCAFHTETHSYAWNGGTCTANAKDLDIPAAFAPEVAGFVSLNNFPVNGAHMGAKIVKLDKATKTWSVVADKAKNGSVSGTQSVKPALPLTRPATAARSTVLLRTISPRSTTPNLFGMRAWTVQASRLPLSPKATSTPPMSTSSAAPSACRPNN